MKSLIWPRIFCGIAALTLSAMPNISSALKIKNAAVHYYFPGKADLGVAVIQRARERFADWARDQRIGSKTPPEKLEAFFRRYLNF